MSDNTENVSSKNNRQNILLGTIAYGSDEDYEQFLNQLDLNKSIFVLIAAANYAQSKGLFKLDESELISKCIKVIKKSSEENNEGAK